MKRAFGFVVVLACLLLEGLCLAADTSANLKIIGILYQDSRLMAQLEGLRVALRDLGYAEGKNLQFKYGLAWPGRDDLDLVAEQLVHARVDLIFAVGTRSAQAARKATQNIPIVFYVADPVGTGLAESLAHPGGNATGLTSIAAEIGLKRLELLKEIVPNAKRFSVLAYTDNPATQRQLQSMEAGSKQLRVSLDVLSVHQTNDVSTALSKVIRKRTDGLILTPDSLLNANQKLIARHAMEARVPSIAAFGGFARAGGLLSYGSDEQEVWRRCAALAVRILNGTKPSELPVEQVSKFKLSVNMKTAKALGLTVPESIRIRADEVIR